MWDVVVIGAGLSGLAAAQALVQTGYAVLVLEKSRGLGGRMATRRVNTTVLDHGCPLLQPLGPYQSDLIDQGLAAGLLQPWSPAVYDLRADQLNLRPDPGVYYTARAGLSAVPKLFTQGLKIQKQAQVRQITALPQGWGIELLGDGFEPLSARSVVMAIPAAQISPLIHLVEDRLEAIRDWQDQLEQVSFISTITVMAGYDSSRMGETGSLLSVPASEASRGWMICSQDHPDLAWMALDSSKRQNAPQPVVVIHSSAAFAETYLHQEDLTPAGNSLLTRGSQFGGAWMATPEWMQVHRWRYGQVSQPLPDQILKTDRLPSLVGCGDWCGGGGVEGAIASGRRAATWITATLG